MSNRFRRDSRGICEMNVKGWRVWFPHGCTVSVFASRDGVACWLSTDGERLESGGPVPELPAEVVEAMREARRMAAQVAA